MQFSILNTTLATLAFFSTAAFPVTFNVIGACSHSPQYFGQYDIDINENIGALSMNFFEHKKIPYTGTIHGLSSINHSPIGLEAIEVLSDSKMRAYGWCFSVNGIIPDSLISDTFVSKQNDHISWFYAYSTYDQGLWSDYCTPSYLIKAPQFCK